MYTYVNILYSVNKELNLIELNFKNNISPFQNSVKVQFCRDIRWSRRL